MNTEVSKVGINELYRSRFQSCAVFKSPFQITWYTFLSFIKHRRHTHRYTHTHIHSLRATYSIQKNSWNFLNLLCPKHEPLITTWVLQDVQNKKNYTDNPVDTKDLSFTPHTKIFMHMEGLTSDHMKVWLMSFILDPGITALIRRVSPPLHSKGKVYWTAVPKRRFLRKRKARASVGCKTIYR